MQINKQFLTYLNFPDKLLNARLVFQSGGGESAPRAPESFKGTEKQSDQDAINEVAPQSPSQIMSAAIGRATVVKTRFQKSTQILGNLISTDPLLNPNLNSNASGNTIAAVGSNQTASSSTTTANPSK